MTMARGDTKDKTELLSAYLDGELDESSIAEVEALLAKQPEAHRLLDELRETRALLKGVQPAEAPQGLLEDIIAGAERRALLGQGSESSPKMPKRQIWAPIRAAAVIVILIGGAGTWIFYQIDRNESPVNGSASRIAGLDHATENGEETLSGLALADAGEPARPSNGGSVFGESPDIRVKSSGRGRRAAAPGSKGLAGAEAERAAFGPEIETFSTAEGSVNSWTWEENQVVTLEDDLTDSLMYFAVPDRAFASLRKAADAQTVDVAIDESDLTAQLSAGASAETLARYDFANLSNVVELTLDFPDEVARDEFAGITTDYFASNQILNLADPVQRARVVQPAAQQVYLPGRGGVNYADLDSRQYIVMAPAETIDHLLERFEAGASSFRQESEAQVRIGKRTTRGLANSRAVARLLGEPQWRETMLADTTPTSKTVPRRMRAVKQDNQFLGGRTLEEWEDHYERLARARTQDAGSHQKETKKAKVEAARESSMDEKQTGTTATRPAQLGASLTQANEPADLGGVVGGGRGGREGDADGVKDDASNERRVGRNLTFILNLRSRPRFVAQPTSAPTSQPTTTMPTLKALAEPKERFLKPGK